MEKREKARGMEAVVSKLQRRRMGLKRKGAAPGIAIVVGSAPPEKPEADEPEGELECPKCGAILKDTPENREYVASKDMDDESDEVMESEDDDEEGY